MNDSQISLRDWINERLRLMDDERASYRREHAAEHERLEARRAEAEKRVTEDIVSLTADINASGLRIDGKLDALAQSHQQSREQLASLRTALFVMGTVATVLVPAVTTLIVKFVH